MFNKPSSPEQQENTLRISLFGASGIPQLDPKRAKHQLSFSGFLPPEIAPHYEQLVGGLYELDSSTSGLHTALSMSHAAHAILSAAFEHGPRHDKTIDRAAELWEKGEQVLRVARGTSNSDPKSSEILAHAAKHLFYPAGLAGVPGALGNLATSADTPLVAPEKHKKIYNGVLRAAEGFTPQLSAELPPPYYDFGQFLRIKPGSKSGQVGVGALGILNMETEYDPATYFGVLLTEESKISKDDMPCNKPRATPGHSKKSHVVKACSDGKEKIIRFGQKGVKGSPKKEGESESYRKRRKAFKARHAKNIKKGKMSAAYWANRVKW